MESAQVRAFHSSEFDVEKFPEVNYSVRFNLGFSKLILLFRERRNFFSVLFIFQKNKKVILNPVIL